MTIFWQFFFFKNSPTIRQLRTFKLSGLIFARFDAGLSTLRHPGPEAEESFEVFSQDEQRGSRRGLRKVLPDEITLQNHFSLI